MNVNKLFSFLIFIFSIQLFSQNPPYPKDTIYVKFENKIGQKKWNNKFKYSYEGRKGVFFNVEDINGDMAFFYNLELKTDTLCINQLKNYHFLDLEEVNKKEWQYYKKRFDGWPIIRNKNWVFHTYLIEIISEKKFVIYPVEWRNEGVID